MCNTYSGVSRLIKWYTRVFFLLFKNIIAGIAGTLELFEMLSRSYLILWNENTVEQFKSRDYEIVAIKIICTSGAAILLYTKNH